MSCAGFNSTWPGSVITLPLNDWYLDYFDLHGGDAPYSIGTGDGDFIVLQVSDFRESTNPPSKDTVTFGLTCGIAVNWRKAISGWNGQFKTVGTTYSRPPFSGSTEISLTVSRVPCQTAPSTVLLTKDKGIFAGMVDMYHLNVNQFWQFYGGKKISFHWLMEDGAGWTPAMEAEYAANPLWNPRPVEITCAEQSGGRITSVGGWCPPPRVANRWKFTSEKVMNLITKSRVQFFVTLPTTLPPPHTGPRSKIVIATDSGGKLFLKAQADGSSPSSLLALSSCPPLTHSGWFAAQITCIKKTNLSLPHQRIESIGGRNWELTVQEAIAKIEGQGQAFYVEQPAGHRVPVVIARSSTGHKYLKTVADGIQPNNLLALPQCS